MTPDGLEAIALVCRFLTESVLPSVPRTMTAELRAAIKLLETARLELSRVFPVLRDECRELLLLCEDADKLLPELALSPITVLREQVERDGSELPALLSTHNDLLERVSRQLCSLQAVADKHPTRELYDLLQRHYRALGRQAETRLAWQAVFPASGIWTETDAPEGEHP